MRKPRNSSNKWTELEQRISTLESIIDARLSKTDIRGVPNEGSSATGTANGNAENAPQLADMTSDESVGIDFTKQNVSTDCWQRQGARPKRKKVLT